jgi:hypothetical protein
VSVPGLPAALQEPRFLRRGRHGCRGRRRGRLGAGQRAQRQQRFGGESAQLRVGLVECAGRQSGAHLRARGLGQIGQLHRLTVTGRAGLAVGDDRQLVAAVQTRLRERLVQWHAQDRHLDALHDGHRAVDAGDVVIAADDGTADSQPGKHKQDGESDPDQDPPSRSGRRRGRLDLGRNPFGDLFARGECRGAARRGAGPGKVPHVGLTGHRAGDDRLGGSVVVVDDVGDHHGHVVGSAAAQSQFDEPVGAVGGVGNLERVLDGLVAHRVGKPVGAQQVAIPEADLAHGQRRLDLVARQRAHDQRPLRVAVRLFLGDSAVVDQRLDERVVFGDLRQLAVAHQVAPRVTDVGHPNPVACEEDCGQGGAHPLEVGFHFDLRCDRRIAGVDRGVELGEQVAAGLVVVEVGECGNDQLRSHFTGGVPAHTVGERQQSCAGVHRVFVVGSHQADIAARCIAQDQSHGRNSITVLPILTGVRMGTRTAVVTFALSRYVPLVDPRSSTYHSVPRWESRACRVDA